MTPPAGRAERVRFASRVDFAKEEVFEVCATLALAESVLTHLGRPLEALGAARAFELMEGRLGGARPESG